MDHSDHRLVSETLAGSSDAFEQLMRRYQRLVYRVAYGFTRDRECAMDVTQETFLKVHARLGSWRCEGELKNWIVRIASREAMDHERSRASHPTCALEEDIPLPHPTQEQGAQERETRGALHRSLSRLNPRQRLAIVLRYFQGMNTHEIAAVLECSEDTARNMLCRGLRKLRSMMPQSEESLP